MPIAVKIFPGNKIFIKQDRKNTILQKLMIRINLPRLEAISIIFSVIDFGEIPTEIIQKIRKFVEDDYLIRTW